MKEMPCFTRNRCTSVEPVDHETLRSTCRLQDTLTDAWVEVTVKLPELEITGVRGDFQRTHQDACRDPADALQKALGVRVGPGALKILKGLVGESTECSQLVFLLEECCHGIILSFTRDTMRQVPEDYELTAEDFRKMIRDNIRLYNRCAAFAPGSSMVEGIDPPE